MAASAEVASSDVSFLLIFTKSARAPMTIPTMYMG
jgi:hypothetical protein